MLYLIILLPLLFGCQSITKRANHVEVVNKEGRFEMLVNGTPFYIQGVGVGKAFGSRGENYLRMAKEMGANTVRTWGVDQGNRRYLDEARRQGLLVAAGIWVNYAEPKQGVSYIGENDYLRKKENEILDYVKRFKDHPAILMWNLGNEAFVFTADPKERVALAQFLEKMVLKIRAIDPHHPVVYASANVFALTYLKDYVPSLDIVGMNIYGSVISAEARWKGLEFKIPYVVTEFGPLGPWDLPKDRYGKVMEPSDTEKASQYKNHWKLIRERKGNNVGGFVFHLGETTQETLTFWNLNDGRRKKASFITMQQFFAGKTGLNQAPKIASFTGVPDKIRPGGLFKPAIKASDPEGEPLEHVFTASTVTQGVMKYFVNEEIPLQTRGGGQAGELTAPLEPGVYRIYAFARDPSGNSAVTSRTMMVE